jgi:hypothetical protein
VAADASADGTLIAHLTGGKAVRRKTRWDVSLRRTGAGEIRSKLLKNCLKIERIAAIFTPFGDFIWRFITYKVMDANREWRYVL